MCVPLTCHAVIDHPLSISYIVAAISSNGINRNLTVSASQYSNKTITKVETQGRYTLIKQSNSSSRLGKVYKT